MRTSLLYLSEAEWARRIITSQTFARRAAARFVAGDTLEECLGIVMKLNEENLMVTLDHLGERVTSLQKASQATEDYLTALEGIEEAGARATISLKLTQLGLPIDFEVCLDNMFRIARRADELSTFVRIDMEDSHVLEQTLQTYRTLTDAGLMNVGVVIQSYLRRSPDDTQALLSRGARIRLVKGAYNEPPEVAYPAKGDVDAVFDQLAAMMIKAALKDEGALSTPDGKCPAKVAIATHDEKRISFARDYAAEVGLPKEGLEFQMLYGIADRLQRSLRDDGYPVRIYVPYGTEWFPYYTRRLAERPANLLFLLSHLVRR